MSHTCAWCDNDYTHHPSCPAANRVSELDSLRAEVAALEVECQLQRNLLGNATGAALDVGLAGGVTAHDAIYLLTAERDVLRLALVKWRRARNGGDEFDESMAGSALYKLIMDADDWGLGVTGGEPEQ